MSAATTNANDQHREPAQLSARLRNCRRWSAHFAISRFSVRQPRREARRPAPSRRSIRRTHLFNIRPDGKIVIQVNRLEFGQGVQTALPMILADEMDADWSQVVAELAPAADVYKDPLFGIQMVGGSGSIAHSFQQYRELGAKTRAMLVAAAAERWNVTPDQCRTEQSVVHGPERPIRQVCRTGERRRAQARAGERAAQKTRRNSGWSGKGSATRQQAEV